MQPSPRPHILYMIASVESYSHVPSCVVSILDTGMSTLNSNTSFISVMIVFLLIGCIEFSVGDQNERRLDTLLILKCGIIIRHDCN
jgi:hypothetical protein